MTQVMTDNVELTDPFSDPQPMEEAVPASAAPDFGPLWLLLLALLAVTAGWLPGRVLLPAPDAGNGVQRHLATEIAPWTQLAADRLAHGGVPLWNPNDGLGAPLLANGEVGVFYPTVLLHMAMPEEWAWAVSGFFCLWTAGLGMWWLGRRWGLSSAGRLVAGIGFMFCGANIFWLNQPVGQVVLLMPLALALLYRMMSGGGVLSMALLALVTAVAVAAGRADAATAFIAVLLMGWIGMALGSAICLPEQRRITPLYAFFGLALLVGAIAVGVMASGVQWVTFVQYLQDWGTEAFRQGRGTGTPQASFAPLAALLAPAGVGWDHAGGWIGIVVLLLAAGGLLRGMRHGALGWFLLAAGCAALACSAIGERLILQKLNLWWDFTPVLMGAAAAGLAMLAGIGLDCVLADRSDSRSFQWPAVLVGSAIVFVLGLGLACAGWLLARRLLTGAMPNFGAIKPVAIVLALHAAGLAIAWAALRSRSGVAGWGFAVAVECAGVALVLNPGSHLSDHPALRPGAEAALASFPLSPDSALVPPRVRLLLQDSHPAPGTPFAQLAGGTTTQPARALPAAWIARTTTHAPTAAAAIADDGKPGLDPLATAVIDPGLAPEYDNIRNPKDAPFCSLQRSAAPVSGRPAIEWQKQAPENLRLQITNGGGGWLVLRRAFAPGWSAVTVSASEARSRRGSAREREIERDALIFPAYGFLQAIPLPTGAPQMRRGSEAQGGFDVVVRYAPRGWKHGRLVSLAGALVLLMATTGKLISDRMGRHRLDPETDMTEQLDDGQES